jgi:general stress protein 26
MNEIAIEAPVETPRARNQQRDELLERLRKTPTCMLFTHDAAGGMHVRPMTTQEVDNEGVIWMFTAANGRLVNEVAANPAVLISYADPGDGAFAAVRGEAMALRDLGKQRELWTAIAGAWFPGGADDPNLMLLRITMGWAEHWEPTDGKVVQFLEIAAAALTKSVPDHDGVYRRLDF